MPYKRGTDGDIEDLPTYILRAFDHDRSWMAEGLCHPRNRTAGFTSHTWALVAGETRVIDGKRWDGDNCERAALSFCAICPVQWSCTRWALDVDERTGTWGISFSDLKWLKRQPDSTMIVDAAAANSIPISRAVSLARDAREVASGSC